MTTRETRGLDGLAAGAARLGVSPHTLRYWAVYQHRVPYIKLGRRILFDPAELEDFARRHRVPARQEQAR